MKKYLVIGNPIEHSLSPVLHNYWIKENNISAVYEKKKLEKNDIEEIIGDIKKGKIDGINVTVPFKNYVIIYLDQLTSLAHATQSVNTVFKKNDKIVGHNTDVGGFEYALKNINFNVKDKEILILGAGGVVPSIILALNNLGASRIYLTNRTQEKADKIKQLYKNLKIINWETISDPLTFKSLNFDMFINATSIGLQKDDEINLGCFSAFRKYDLGKNKLFYDVIYNPKETKFLLKAKQIGHQIENGKMMFVYQAQLAFKIWHKILPKIDSKTINLIDI